jgi:hypothetical protein
MHWISGYIENNGCELLISKHVQRCNIHHWSYEIKEGKLEEAYATHSGDEKCKQKLGGGTCSKGTSLKTQEDNIKVELKWDRTAWIGLMWFRTGTSGGYL